MIKDNEVIDDLMVNNLKIIQKSSGFKFGIDAVLLAYFASTSKAKKTIDLGTGTGIIPILLSGKYGFESVYGLEIQEEYTKMANRSLNLNDLNEKVKIFLGDIKKIDELFIKNTFNLVISNPPYKLKGSGIINDLNSKSIARHEIKCNFEDIVIAAKYLLKQNGEFIFIHRTDRLVDILYAMRKYNIEPKYIRLVYSTLKKEPKLVLIKGLNNGNRQLNFLKPLIIYEKDNSYTDEVKKIYFGQNQKIN